MASNSKKNNLLNAISKALYKTIREIGVLRPCEIVNFDRKKNRASVKFILDMVDKDGILKAHEPIASVPILNLGAGDGLLSFNLVKGNMGWLFATDNDISDFLVKYKTTTSNTNRSHDFSSALFIPDIIKHTDFSIAEEDSENMVLQSLDGTKRISFFPDQIKITSPKLLIDAETEITENVKMNKSLVVEETSTALDHISDGISGSGHRHAHGEPLTGPPSRIGVNTLVSEDLIYLIN